MRQLHPIRLLLGFTIGLLAMGGPAWAHAHLVSAVPPTGGTVTTGPNELRLTFSEPLEIKFSAVTLTMNDGMDMGSARVTLDPADAKVLIAHLAAPLDPGSYTVHWHVMSVDTHKTKGDYTVTVR